MTYETSWQVLMYNALIVTDYGLGYHLWVVPLHTFSPTFLKVNYSRHFSFLTNTKDLFVGIFCPSNLHSSQFGRQACNCPSRTTHR